MDDAINFTVPLPSPHPSCFHLNLTEISIYPYLTCDPSPPPVSIIIPPNTRGRNSVHLSTLILLSVSIVSSLLLIVVTFFAALDSRRRRRRRNISLSPMTEPPPPAAATEADHLDGGLMDEQPGDHHVWYIRTPGLDAATIATIPLLSYDPEEHHVDGSDCAVCLGEFVTGDAIRRLPLCGHAFHLSCIDTWLASHLNCPICRALVISPKSNSLSPTASSSSSSYSSSSSSSSSIHPMSSDSGPSSSDSKRLQVSIELQTSASMPQVECSDSETTNIEDYRAILPENSLVESPISEFPDDLEDNDFHTVPRPTSMDPVAADALFIHVEGNNGLIEDAKEIPSVDPPKQGSNGQGFIVLPMSLMGRSLSGSRRWFSFSKRGRLAQSSVLPL